MVKTQKEYSLGPLSAHQRNTILMVFRRWADSGPLLNANCEVQLYKSTPSACRLTCKGKNAL